MKTHLKLALIALAIGTPALAAQPIGAVKTDIGKVFVSAESGMTLYTFRKDARNQSNCYDDCATAWPPFLASASAEPSGPLGIIKRKDSARQWTLNGKPLYFWQGDSELGDVTGDGVGGVWDAVKQ